MRSTPAASGSQTKLEQATHFRAQFVISMGNRPVPIQSFSAKTQNLATAFLPYTKNRDVSDKHH
jgi:hypothetical protein